MGAREFALEWLFRVGNDRRLMIYDWIGGYIFKHKHNYRKMPYDPIIMTFRQMH
jgi:hypothetical protein